MQRDSEGLRKGDSSELYFETKHNHCTGKHTMGSLARAGSEARPGSERRRLAAGWRPVPSTGQSTVFPAHSGLRPPFTTEERIRSQKRFKAGRLVGGHTIWKKNHQP